MEGTGTPAPLHEGVVGGKIKIAWKQKDQYLVMVN
jgi:hypothetical protein